MSEVATRLQSQKRSWAHPGSAHDRLIRLSLIFLPVGIGVLSAFLVLAPLLTKGDVSFVLDKNKVDVAQERMKIERALYRGEDNRGRAFALTAGQAVQKSSAEPIVELNDLAARIQLKDGPAQLVAPRGRYDMKSEQVKVLGPIRFTAADGYVLGTRDATVDLKTRKLASGGAASGTTPLGTFSGNQLTADLEARTVALKGNARLRIVPRRAK